MSCVGRTRECIHGAGPSYALKKPSCEDELLLKRVEENEQELKKLSGRFDRMNDECAAKLSLLESRDVQCNSPDESELLRSLTMKVQSLEQQQQQKNLSMTTTEAVRTTSIMMDDKYHDAIFQRIASMEKVIEEHARSIQAIAEQLSTNSRLEEQTMSMLPRLRSTEQSLQQMKDQLMEVHQQSSDVPKVLTDDVASAPTQIPKENDLAENTAPLEGVQWDVEDIRYNDMTSIFHDWSYRFHQSIWGASVFLGHPAIGVLGSLGTAFALFLNISIQTLFICIVFFVFDHSDPEFPSAKTASEWRIADGHNSVFADPDSRISLVSRVCGDDETLSLATRQAEAIENINDYVESFVGLMERGVLVCLAVNMLWFCHCVSEVMDIYNFATSILHIRKGRITELSMVEQEIEIVTITWTRTYIALMVACLRVGVAASSLIAGSLWLSQTLIIEDLVLNIAGLAVIMDVDEILYGTFVPTMAKCLVEMAKPLPKRRQLIVSGLSWNSVVFPILLTAVCLGILHGIVLPNKDEMLATEKEFCDGTKNFISGLHPEMKLFFTARVPQFEPNMVLDDSSGSRMMTAGIQELIGTKFTETGRSTDIRLSYFSPEVGLMDSSMETKASDWVFFFGCNEDHFGSTYDLIYADTLRKLVEPTPTTCQEVEQYCTRKDWPLVRMMCPLTCGCASPFGGLYHVTGCPMENCLASRPFNEHRMNASCEDLSITTLSTHIGWGSYWERLEIEEMGHGWGEGAKNKAKEIGCEILTRPWYRSLCVGSGSVGFLNAFCPVTCQCWLRANDGACPAACFS